MSYDIKLFTDYICPFCYIGKGILNELKKEFDIKDEIFNIEIHPGTPEEGEDLRIKFYYNDIDKLYDGLRETGKQYGVTFGDVRLLPNSHKATVLAEYAKEKDKFAEFSENIFKAYFINCLDISKDEILFEIAETAGLDIPEAEKALQDVKYIRLAEKNMKEAAIHGVESVPTFIINDKYKIAGSQPLEAFRELFNRLQKEENGIVK